MVKKKFFSKITKHSPLKILLLSVFIPFFTQYAEAKTVLLLNSYSYDMEWTRSITEAVSERFKEREDIELLVEFLDTKRHTDEKYYSVLDDILTKKYSNQSLDLIITSDDNASRFALDKREDLFPEIPIVFCGVNDTKFPGRKDFVNITGVLEVPGFKETLQIAKSVFPSTQNVYLINESKTIGTGDREDLQEILDSFGADFTSTWLEDKSAEEITTIFNTLPEHSVILLLSFFGDKGSEVFSIPDGAAFISNTSTAPVFSMWEYFLGKGIIGGLLTSATYQGYSAAEIGLQILDGRPITDIPVVSTTANQFMFDKNILDKFGIEVDELPEDSVLINDPSSVISLYKYHIAVVIFSFLLLMAIISFQVYSARIKRKLEHDLKKNEERLRLAMQANMDGLWDWDVTTGEVYYSPGYISMLGYTEEESKEHVDFWSSLIHPDDKERALKVNDDCIENKLSNFRVEFRMKAKDGEWHWILGRGSAVVRDENGMALRMTGTHTDITERKIIEQELMQAQKMEAIGTLAGGIAHDFNNLLMGIQGSASLALRKIDPSEKSEQSEHLSSIIQYSGRAAELTKQLLGLARTGKYDPRPTNINTLIENTTKMFGRTKKELIIDHQFADQIWAVEVDHGQIEQVLLNLYVNAWQAMPTGGCLTVNTENIEPEIASSLNLPGGYVRHICIRVSDTGVGIKPEILNKIFEPFFTTKDRGRGTGLGLASAYGIIQNHTGSIKVFSKVGEGTTFEIYLPATSKTIVDEPQIDDSILSGEGTILIVDDESLILDITSDILKELGYETYLAKGGEEAVSLYAESKDNIDLVILDMVMPGMSGKETFMQLKEIDPEVKVILSSGYSIDGQAVEIMQNGCKGFIQKPFSIKELSSKLDKVFKTDKTV